MDCRWNGSLWKPGGKSGGFCGPNKIPFRDFVNNHPKEDIQLKSQWKMFCRILNMSQPLPSTWNKKDACHPRKSSPQNPTKNPQERGQFQTVVPLKFIQPVGFWSNLEPSQHLGPKLSSPPRSFVCLTKILSPHITTHGKPPQKKNMAFLTFTSLLTAPKGLEDVRFFSNLRVQNVRVFPSLCLLLPVSQPQNRRLKVSITSVQRKKNLDTSWPFGQKILLHSTWTEVA